MAAMEGVVVAGGGTGGVQDQSQPQQPPAVVVERLNPAVQQQLNLDSVKTRAISLYKAISRILEDLDTMSRNNVTPKWQEMLGQFSMVNLELFNIVEDVKKVSKAFVVHPRNVTAESATILPVMLSTKQLPEMEMEDNSMRDQLLHGMQHLPVAVQIEKLKTRIDMINAACESAEKVIAETRKAYFGTRQGPTMLPTIDKVQAAKIHEQETLLRNAVNNGEGLRLPLDQRQITSTLPAHLVDVLRVNENTQTIPIPSPIPDSGLYQKNTPPLSSNVNTQGNMLQGSVGQLIGRAVASPSNANVNALYDNTITASPMQYANSPRSGGNIMNTPSPQQQQIHNQQIQIQQQQQRQKMMQLPQHQQQQLLAQHQQFRQQSNTMPALGQNQLSQLNDLQGQQKYQQQLQNQHQMQFSQPLGSQQFQNRQLPSGVIQQGQLNQGNHLNRQLNQFNTTANNALFSAASNSNPQMIPNMSSMMSSQSLLPRMQQYGVGTGNRNLSSQTLGDQMFGNPGNMMPMQQGQIGSQGGYGSMPQSTPSLQNNMLPLQNTAQNHPSFQQPRPPTQ